MAGSRIGSEAAARVYRSHGYDLADRKTMAPRMEQQMTGIITPQSGSSGQQMLNDAIAKPLVGQEAPSDAFSVFYKQTPDEKLFEALDSPKDRMFLLRLEQDVIEFVKNST